jgi:hypothetical protein
MGTMGTLELPARMSPCLRLFIEILFDEVDVKRSASWHQNHEIQSTTPKVIQTCTPSPARGASIKDEYVTGLWDSNGCDDRLGVHRMLIKRNYSAIQIETGD